MKGSKNIIFPFLFLITSIGCDPIDLSSSDLASSSVGSGTASGVVQKIGGGGNLLQFPNVNTSSIRKIDFLFIVDHSRSNKVHLLKKNLAPKIKTLPSKLSDIDWRMYFITSSIPSNKTAEAELKVMKLELNQIIIDSSFLSSDVATQFYSSNSEDIFMDTISHDKMGTCKLPPYCSSKARKDRNRPVKSLEHFLKEGGLSLLRKEAELVVVMITNSDEQPAEGASTQVDVKILKNTIETILEDDKKFYSIGIIPNTSGKQCNRNNKHARYIADFLIKTKGRLISLCATQEQAFASGIIQFITDDSQTYL